MTQQPSHSQKLKGLRSPFTKAIAASYYDGLVEGFLAHCDWTQACVFRLLDWDRETDLRVYEVARVEDLEFEDAVSLLFRDRRPSWPLWVLPSTLREQGQQLVDQCFGRARAVAMVTTSDLLGHIAEWDGDDDAPQSSTLLARAERRDPEPS